MATVALICGIIGIVLGVVVIGIIPSIVAIVLAIKSNKKYGKDGKATAGLICGIIGILISIAMLSPNADKADVNDDHAIADVSSEKDNKEDVTASKTVSEGDVSISEEKDVDTDESVEVSIDETVLLDQDGIVITATGISDSWLGTTLDVLIENNSDKNVTIQVRKASVNGYMADTVFSADVVAGKKSNDNITFTTSGLKYCGIDIIADMEFAFHVFDSETWDGIFDSDLISVKTKAANTYKYEYDDSGELIYDQDGLKVVAKGISETDSIFGPGLVLYVDNQSGQNVTIQARDTSINGFMVDPIFSCEIVDGKHAIDAVTFLSSELEKNGIEQITEVETSFHIFNTDSWNAIKDTDTITLKY